MSPMTQFEAMSQLMSLCSVPGRRGRISGSKNMADLSTQAPPPVSSEALVNAIIQVSPNDEIKAQHTDCEKPRSCPR